MNEHQLIDLLRPLAAPEAEGFSNDAAALTIPNATQLIVTTDTLVAGVHYIGNEPAERIAQKALRTNLSDLAAMGATPYRYSLAFSLPKETNHTWCEAFVAGLAEDQKRYDLSLLGGDTTHTPAALTVTITAMGLAPKGSALTRSGAQEGDSIYVTGTLGEAAMGLKVAQGSAPHNAHLMNRYQLPQPRVEAIPLLRNVASAAMDISDGLAIDLHRLCAASNAGAMISFIPRSPAGSASCSADHSVDDAALNAALYGGDDYELLFTAALEHHDTIMSTAESLPFPITKIGEITPQKEGIMLQKYSASIPLKSKGYQHEW